MPWGQQSGVPKQWLDALQGDSADLTSLTVLPMRTLSEADLVTLARAAASSTHLHELIITRKIGKVAGTHRSLRVLDVGSAEMGDDVIALVATWDSATPVEELRLEHRGIASKEAAAALGGCLAKCTQLRKVSLRRNTGLSAEALCVLWAKAAGRPSDAPLELDLSGVGCTEEALAALVDAAGADADADQGLAAALVHLDVTGASAREYAPMLHAAPRLTSLVLDDTACGAGSGGAARVSALAAGLAAHATLQRIRLTRCAVGADGAVALAQALRGHASLTELALAENAIGDEGAAALASLLHGVDANGDAVPTKLAVLDVAKNDIAAWPFRALPPALHSLDVSANPLGDAGLDALTTLLNANASANEPSSSSPSPSPSASSSSGGGHTQGTSLRLLHLVDVRASQDAVVRLLERVGQGALPQLERLYLMGNHTDEKEMVEVVKTLVHAPRGRGIHVDVSSQPANAQEPAA